MIDILQNEDMMKSGKIHSERLGKEINIFPALVHTLGR